MAFNWKETLIGIGLPVLEGVETQLVDSSLDNYFVKNPDNYKKIVPAAYNALSDLAPVFADNKITSGVLAALLAGIEQSMGDEKVEKIPS